MHHSSDGWDNLGGFSNLNNSAIIWRIHSPNHPNSALLLTPLQRWTQSYTEKVDNCYSKILVCISSAPHKLPRAALTAVAVTGRAAGGWPAGSPWWHHPGVGGHQEPLEDLHSHGFPFLRGWDVQCQHGVVMGPIHLVGTLQPLLPGVLHEALEVLLLSRRCSSSETQEKALAIVLALACCLLLLKFIQCLSLYLLIVKHASPANSFPWSSKVWEVCKAAGTAPGGQ